MSTIDQAQIRESPPPTDRHPNHWAIQATNIKITPRKPFTKTE